MAQTKLSISFFTALNPPASSPTASPNGWNLDHSYARLPEILHERWKLTPVTAPRLVIFNRPLAIALGLDAEALDHVDHAALFAGHTLPPGAQPIAQAYAGHQYGNFTGLGDGRALLLGEQITPAGQRFDIQLKGSGPTPFSRGGDGRAALGPMLREYLISEAMHALGIPTTRSLAVAATGESIIRREGRIPGAVLTRVAASHIRVGTFEWAAAHQDKDALLALVHHTLDRHYPDLATSDDPALTLLKAVINRQAALVARWMHVGFVHGVLNTDNVALSGETIDYGPCAFMDRYDPETTFSSIDRHKRYAFAKQSHITQWNMARLAEALLPVLHPEEERALERANTAIQAFPDQFQGHWLNGMRAKLGLFTSEAEDTSLIESLLTWMAENEADYTYTFVTLTRASALEDSPFPDPTFQAWHAQWKNRREREARTPLQSLALMQAHNPVVIPRNHKVEEALAAASEQNDFNPLHRLLAALAQPFDHHSPIPAEFTEPAPTTDAPYQTYCGT
jgi:uncharacterized protein YdiU (UPF0061 family)